MSSTAEITYDQKEIAKFFSEKIVEIYREIDPARSVDNDISDILADGLLQEYKTSRSEKSFSGEAPGSFENTRRISTFSATRSSTILDKTLDIIPVLKINIKVVETGGGGHVVKITPIAFGKNLDGMDLYYENGKASVTHKYLSPLVDIWYTIKLNVNNGFHGEFDADIKVVGIKKFHVGPLNLDI